MQELEAGDSGLRSVRVGAKRAFDVRDFMQTAARNRSKRLLAGDGQGKIDRMLRADRTGHARTGRDGNAGRGATATDGFSTGPSDGSRTDRSADVAIVWAKVEEGITGFLVEKGTPDFRARHPRKILERASITSEC